MATESESPDSGLDRAARAPAPAQPSADSFPNFDLSLTPADDHAGHTTAVREITDAVPGILDSSDLQNLFNALDKAVRARRLYQANNPVYLSFLSHLKDAFVRIWAQANSLTVTVEEHGFLWNDHLYSVGEGRDNLAFQFYKDGIRFLTFLPTFEQEIERFMDVVHRVRSLDSSSDDDMVTVLWEKEFEALQYSYVDALAEGLALPELTPVTEAQRIDPELISTDLSGGAEEEQPAQQPYSQQQGQPPVASTITREDFEETLYFLEPAELESLRKEVELEWRRDLKTDVLNALFDRIEDPMPERQTEILRILRQLLPAFLGRGDLQSASRILVELNAIVQAGDVLGEEQTKQAQELFAELSDPAVLTQLLKSLEEGAIDPSGGELGVFLQHMGSGSLALLIRATETSGVAALQLRLRSAVEHLGRSYPAKLMELIRSDDDVIAVGAARLSGQMVLTESASAIAGLLNRRTATTRKAAVEALVQLRSSAAMEGLQHALDDDDREVRIAAARGLGTLHYQPARSRLEELIQSNRLRDSDLTEKIAFFEAYGAVANAESVAMLDRMLNGRNLLRQKAVPELRACAAMALGKVGTPASRAALEKASDENHPMVRNAVFKALRQELPAR